MGEWACERLQKETESWISSADIVFASFKVTERSAEHQRIRDWAQIYVNSLQHIFSLKRLPEALCVVPRWKRSCVVWGHFLLVLAQRQPAGEEANEELHHCHGLLSPTDSYTCPSFSQRGAKGEHRRLRLPVSPVRWFELSWLRLMPRMVRITPTPPRQRGLLRLNAFMLTAVLHQPVETTVIQNPAFPQESSSAGVCALSHSLTQLWQMWGQSRTWVEVGRGYYDEM